VFMPGSIADGFRGERCYATLKREPAASIGAGSLAGK